MQLIGSVAGSIVRDNVIDGADYAGILFGTNKNSDVSGARITGNQVRDTCGRVRDCGAIYINDRGRRSSNILIADNQVSGFGPLAARGRAIYIDDWASHVTVRRNKIAGPGFNAFQIHGGHDNIIEQNSVDMQGIGALLGRVDKFEPISGGGEMDHSKEAVG